MTNEQLTIITEAANEIRIGMRRLHERIESGDITHGQLQREVDEASYATDELWRALKSAADDDGRRQAEEQRMHSAAAMVLP